MRSTFSIKFILPNTVFSINSVWYTAEPQPPSVCKLVFHFLRMGKWCRCSHGLESFGVEGGGGWHEIAPKEEKK